MTVPTVRFEGLFMHDGAVVFDVATDNARVGLGYTPAWVAENVGPGATLNDVRAYFRTHEAALATAAIVTAATDAAHGEAFRALGHTAAMQPPFDQIKLRPA